MVLRHTGRAGRDPPGGRAARRGEGRRASVPRVPARYWTRIGSRRPIPPGKAVERGLTYTGLGEFPTSRVLLPRLP